MKYKTTQRAIKAGYSFIIKVSYCRLQTLLAHESPVAYTIRREGWAADIYDMGGGVAIVTGYATFGNIAPTYEFNQEWEEKAEKIRYDYSLSWEVQRDKIKALAQEYVKAVLKSE